MERPPKARRADVRFSEKELNNKEARSKPLDEKSRTHRALSEPRDNRSSRNRQDDDKPKEGLSRIREERQERGRDKGRREKRKHKARSAPREAVPQLVSIDGLDDESSAKEAERKANESCIICCSHQSNTTTLCGHEFCWDCLKKWVADHHNCPFCRQRMCSLMQNGVLTLAAVQENSQVPAQVPGATVYRLPSNGSRVVYRANIKTVIWEAICSCCHQSSLQGYRAGSSTKHSYAIAIPEDVTILGALLRAKSDPSDVGFTIPLPPLGPAYTAPQPPFIPNSPLPPSLAPENLAYQEYRPVARPIIVQRDDWFAHFTRLPLTQFSCSNGKYVFATTLIVGIIIAVIGVIIAVISSSALLLVGALTAVVGGVLCIGSSIGLCCRIDKEKNASRRPEV